MLAPPGGAMDWFVVSAGPLGKIYCKQTRAKRRGRRDGNHMCACCGALGNLVSKLPADKTYSPLAWAIIGEMPLLSTLQTLHPRFASISASLEPSLDGVILHVVGRNPSTTDVKAFSGSPGAATANSFEPRPRSTSFEAPSWTKLSGCSPVAAHARSHCPIKISHLVRRRACKL